MNTVFKIRYSKEALDDIRGIYAYIAYTLQVEEIAQKQVNPIRKAIRKLSQFPERHPVLDREPWKNLSVRTLYVDNYIVYYSVTREDFLVTIGRILYKRKEKIE